MSLKIANYMDLRFDEADFQYFVNLLFDRLAIFCIIEACWENDTQRWTYKPGRILQVSDSKFLVLGSYKRAQELAVSPTDIKQHLVYTFPARLNVGFGLVVGALPHIDVEQMSFVKSNSALIGVSELPSLNEIVEKAVSLVEPSSFFEGEGLEKLSDQYKWESITVPVSELTHGLYRVQRQFERPSYYCLKKVNSKIILTKIVNEDWAMFVVSWLTGVPLEWGFSRSKSALKIPSMQFYLLPLQLKRFLCAHSFCWPKIESSYFVFYDMTDSATTMLADKFGVKLNYA